MNSELDLEAVECLLNADPSTRSCYNCIHLFRETESWELSHIWWWTCAVKEERANLRSFPYQNTKCKDWESKHRSSHANTGESEC